MRNLNSKTAVITGAGSGIGRALAQCLAARGAHLALVDINELGVSRTAGDLGSCDKVTTHVADVSDREAMSALAEEVAQTHSGADILINNAGITALARFADHDLDNFERIMNINFRGVVYGCKAFLPQLVARQGHIVNLSSIAGLAGMPYQTAYCASKFAVRGFSEALRCEVHGQGVGVTCVHPGVVRTNIMTSAEAMGTERRDMLAGLMAKHVVSPAWVARRIVSAIQRNTPILRVCPESHLLDWTRRATPGLLAGAMRMVHDRLGDA